MAFIDPAQRIQAELGPGESLLWTGRPGSRWDLEWTDFAQFGFILFICAIWAFLYRQSRSLGGFREFEWFWIAMMFLFSAAPLGVKGKDALRRRSTLYGITNKRILIVTDFFGLTKTSFDLRTLSDISVTEKRDGTGTVLFGYAPFFSVARRGLRWPGVDWYSPRRLERIDQAHGVYEALVDARRAAA